ncbi:MAG: acyl-CoA thioester hydrolase/BAAT C-terminal domain-containing protein [Bacteroidota bacterium]
MKSKLTIGIIAITILLVVGYFVIDNLLFDGIKPRSINEQGLIANFFANGDVENRPAIVVIGGGVGGDYWGQEFAKRNYVGLSLPYHRREGLPDLMEEIPLEYFEKAIHWLGAQSQVDQEKIILMGASRNAELALVIASRFPELVSGVIACAPSSISWPNAVLPFNSDSLKPSWTYQGQAIPYLPMRKIQGTEASNIETLPYWMAGLARVDEYPEAIIPVENIGGPILLLSGKDDKIWPSALMSDMIADRLAANDFPHDLENIQFEDAGHLISRSVETVGNGRVGQMNIGGESYVFEYGGTIQGDKSAIMQSWNKVFTFIQKVEGE